MQKNSISFGVLILFIGLILLLGKIGVIHFLWSLLWPLIIMASGLALHYAFFRRQLPSGVLVPGGILITYSLMFLYCNVFGWYSMSYLWPGFIFGVAVGLYELQMFDRYAPRGALTAAVILAAIAAIFFAIAFLVSIGIYTIALILIAVGVLIVIRRPRTW